MSFQRITLSEGREAIVPTDRAEDDDWLAATMALSKSAWPHYNRAVAAYQRLDIITALNESSRALRFFPYSPKILRFSLALSVKHGHYSLAQRILNAAQELGLRELQSTYSSLLERRVRRWNEAVTSPDTLRDRYQREDADVCYRELLLLNQSVEDLTEQEQRYLREYGVQPKIKAPSAPPFFKRPAALATMIGLMGLLAGLAIPQMIVEDENESQPEVVEVEVEPESISTYVAANQLSAEGELIGALDSAQAIPDVSAIESISEEDTTALLRDIRSRMFDRAEEAWLAGNYAAVVEHLEPLRNHDVGSVPERHYYLGVAASEVGRDDLVVSELQRSLEHTGDDHPHFEAQAAYLLALTLDPPESVPYAELIAEDYSNTLYYNSRIASILANDRNG